MTSRERLLTALRLGRPDRLPIQIRGGRASDEEWVATRHLSYRPVIDAVAAHGDFIEGWGAPHGAFILCPTASPHTEVLTDLTVRNYVAMVETAVEYGR
jgi:hypothetical protein